VEEFDGWGMWWVWGRGFLWGNQRERDHLVDSGIDGRIKLKWIFRKWDVGVWSGSIWLMIGPDGGHW